MSAIYHLICQVECGCGRWFTRANKSCQMRDCQHLCHLCDSHAPERWEFGRRAP